MSSDWQSIRLKSVATIVAGQSPKGEDLNEEGAGVPFYQGSKDFGPKYPSRRVFTTSGKRFAESGDLLISLRAPVGRVNVASEHCALGRGVAAIKSLDGRNQGFLRFLFMSKSASWSAQEAEGSVFGNLGKKELENLEIPWPNAGERKRIVWALGSLDDKIEMNRRLAQVLEESAATMFKLRFVDFEGRDKLQESEIGLIPEGWRAGTLAEVVNLINEKEKPEESIDESPYIGLDIMPRGSICIWDWDSRKKVEGETRKFQEGDVLFGKLRPYFRKVGIAPVPGSCSTEILVFRPHEEMLPVVLGHASSERFIDFCMSVARGTRMPRAEWQDIKNFSIAIPPVDEASVLGEPIESIAKLIRALIAENQTLAALRDELLPKLISGKIRVPEGVGPDFDSIEEENEQLVEELAEA
jgi:type I restriction enzyme S subunit